MSSDRMMQFFKYSHLPEHLQQVSRPFCDLAMLIVTTLPSNPEKFCTCDYGQAKEMDHLSHLEWRRQHALDTHQA